MKAEDLKNLLERVQSWPEEAQGELVAVADQIERKLHGEDYFASREELRMIDAAMAALDGGEIASETEIKAAFAQFRSARKLSSRGKR